MTPPRIRSLAPTDAAACVALATSIGWPTDEARWRTMMAIGDALALEHEGELAGTVIVNRFGDALAMIAMMIVGARHRRRGFGTRLMRAALERAGDAIIYLFATDMGRPLYAGLGFEERGACARYEGRLPASVAPESGARPMRDGDFDAILALDAASQGAPRRALLEEFVGEARRVAVVERERRVEAYGIARAIDGSLALGPIVAKHDRDACAIASALAAGAAEPLRLDLEPGERALATWCERSALSLVGTNARMVLGGAALPGDRALVRAMAARAFG